MQRDARAFLWDVRRSADAIARYIDHRDRDGYLADDMLRSAVERQFEIIGEALNQLSQAGSGHYQSHPRTRECRGIPQHSDPWLHAGGQHDRLGNDHRPSACIARARGRIAC